VGYEIQWGASYDSNSKEKKKGILDTDVYWIKVAVRGKQYAFNKNAPGESTFVPGFTPQKYFPHFYFLFSFKNT